MPKPITVYELIGRLAKAPPDQEVHFSVIDPATERLVFGAVTQVHLEWSHKTKGTVVMLDDTSYIGPESQPT
jgi:hypothetical protein